VLFVVVGPFVGLVAALAAVGDYFREKIREQDRSDEAASRDDR
jgi:hypothetical protein